MFALRSTKGFFWPPVHGLILQRWAREAQGIQAGTGAPSLPPVFTLAWVMGNLQDSASQQTQIKGSLV